MNHLLKPISLVILVFFAAGCAQVKFYSEANLKTETGLQYFEAKPFLLVIKKKKDEADAQIIYLPDKTKPQFAKFSPGFGSHKFSVNVANGILTSYGQEADSKIPELIQSMTGLLKEGVATASSAGVFGAQAP